MELFLSMFVLSRTGCRRISYYQHHITGRPTLFHLELRFVRSFLCLCLCVCVCVWTICGRLTRTFTLYSYTLLDHQKPIEGRRESLSGSLSSGSKLLNIYHPSLIIIIILMHSFIHSFSFFLFPLCVCAVKSSIHPFIQFVHMHTNRTRIGRSRWKECLHVVKLSSTKESTTEYPSGIDFIAWSMLLWNHPTLSSSIVSMVFQHILVGHLNWWPFDI